MTPWDENALVGFTTMLTMGMQERLPSVIFPKLFYSVIVNQNKCICHLNTEKSYFYTVKLFFCQF